MNNGRGSVAEMNGRGSVAEMNGRGSVTRPRLGKGNGLPRPGNECARSSPSRVASRLPGALIVARGYQVRSFSSSWICSFGTGSFVMLASSQREKSRSISSDQRASICPAVYFPSLSR